MRISDALPVARFELTVRQLEPLQLPVYAGSMLRGAFGHALKAVACLRPGAACGSCPLRATCPYIEVFETPAPAGNPHAQSANPYVVEAPPPGERRLAGGEEWVFHLVLAGRALRFAGLVFRAWRRALGGGLGERRARARLLSVDLCHGVLRQRVLGASEERLAPFEAPVPEPVPGAARRIDFLTPLRLQEQGRILPPGEVDARRLLMTLARRVQNLLDCHAVAPLRLPLPALATAAAALTLRHGLSPLRWSRFSSRQQQEMALPGLVGPVELEGDASAFDELLAVGELLHVGKNATFGLGHYAFGGAPG